MKIKLLRIDHLIHIVLVPSFQGVSLTSLDAPSPEHPRNRTAREWWETLGRQGWGNRRHSKAVTVSTICMTVMHFI